MNHIHGIFTIIVQLSTFDEQTGTTRIVGEVVGNDGHGMGTTLTVIYAREFNPFSGPDQPNPNCIMLVQGSVDISKSELTAYPAESMLPVAVDMLRANIDSLDGGRDGEGINCLSVVIQEMSGPRADGSYFVIGLVLDENDVPTSAILTATFPADAAAQLEGKAVGNNITIGGYFDLDLMSMKVRPVFVKLTKADTGEES